MAERGSYACRTPPPQACPSAHYALLMLGGHVVAADRSKAQPSLDPLDIMLLANFVTGNPAYRSVCMGGTETVL